MALPKRWVSTQQGPPSQPASLTVPISRLSAQRELSRLNQGLAAWLCLGPQAAKGLGPDPTRPQEMLGVRGPHAVRVKTPV